MKGLKQMDSDIRLLHFVSNSAEIQAQLCIKRLTLCRREKKGNASVAFFTLTRVL
ncbi:MAG: hypothetical protein Q8O50_03535 [Hydrogenophaga sp.]|nr:hypothetical protein [Hydrogenophaga sp.]